MRLLVGAAFLHLVRPGEIRREPQRPEQLPVRFELRGLGGDRALVGVDRGADRLGARHGVHVTLGAARPERVGAAEIRRIAACAGCAEQQEEQRRGRADRCGGAPARASMRRASDPRQQAAEHQRVQWMDPVPIEQARQPRGIEDGGLLDETALRGRLHLELEPGPARQLHLGSQTQAAALLVGFDAPPIHGVADAQLLGVRAARGACPRRRRADRRNRAAATARRRRTSRSSRRSGGSARRPPPGRPRACSAASRPAGDRGGTPP